jgi:hypothetical protein
MKPQHPLLFKDKISFKTIGDKLGWYIDYVEPKGHMYSCNKILCGITTSMSFKSLIICDPEETSVAYFAWGLGNVSNNSIEA